MARSLEVSLLIASDSVPTGIPLLSAAKTSGLSRSLAGKNINLTRRSKLSSFILIKVPRLHYVDSSSVTKA